MSLKNRIDGLMKAQQVEVIGTIDPNDPKLWRVAYERLLDVMPEQFVARLRDYEAGRDRTLGSRLLWEKAWGKAQVEVSEEMVDRSRAARAARGQAVAERKGRRRPLNFTAAECEYVLTKEAAFARHLEKAERDHMSLSYDFGSPESCTACAYFTFWAFRCCPLCGGALARGMVPGQDPGYHQMHSRHLDMHGVDPDEAARSGAPYITSRLAGLADESRQIAEEAVRIRDAERRAIRMTRKENER